MSGAHRSLHSLRIREYGLFLMLSLVGAGLPVLSVQAEAVAPSSIPANLTVDVWHNDVRRQLKPGEVLSSGDQIAIYIEHPTPAYLYVVNWDSQKRIQYLYPAVEQLATVSLLDKGRSRIPEDEGFRITLDRTTGIESLYVVVHSARLTQKEIEAFLHGEMGVQATTAKATATPGSRTAKSGNGTLTTESSKSSRLAPKTNKSDDELPAPFMQQLTRGFVIERAAPSGLETKGAKILRLSIPHR